MINTKKMFNMISSNFLQKTYCNHIYMEYEWGSSYILLIENWNKTKNGKKYKNLVKINDE